MKLYVCSPAYAVYENKYWRYIKKTESEKRARRAELEVSVKFHISFEKCGWREKKNEIEKYPEILHAIRVCKSDETKKKKEWGSWKSKNDCVNEKIKIKKIPTRRRPVIFDELERGKRATFCMKFAFGSRCCSLFLHCNSAQVHDTSHFSCSRNKSKIRAMKPSGIYFGWNTKGISYLTNVKIDFV